VTTLEAVAVLRTIPAGVETARERAITVAIERLLAEPRATAPRKTAAKPKVSQNLAAFLKLKFPTGTTVGNEYVLYEDLTGHAVPTIDGPLAVQLAYGHRGPHHRSTKPRDAAILYAAAA